MLAKSLNRYKNADRKGVTQGAAQAHNKDKKDKIVLVPDKKKKPADR